MGSKIAFPNCTVLESHNELKSNLEGPKRSPHSFSFLSQTLPDITISNLKDLKRRTPLFNRLMTSSNFLHVPNFYFL